MLNESAKGICDGELHLSSDGVGLEDGDGINGDGVIF